MVARLSPEVLEQAMETSGIHSLSYGSWTKEMLGKLDGSQRRVLGLLEALDFGCIEDNRTECIDLGDYTIEDVKSYLVENIEVVKSLPLPPSMLSLTAGHFNFLFDKGE